MAHKNLTLVLSRLAIADLKICILGLKERVMFYSLVLPHFLHITKNSELC